MDTALAQFRLEDGTEFLVEVPEPENEDAIEEVAINPEQMVYQAKQTLESALDQVQPVAAAVVSRLKSGMPNPADEVEVKFALKLSAEAGAIFSTVGGEVNFEITMKWQKEK